MREKLEAIEIKKLSYDPDVIMDTISHFMEEENVEARKKKLAEKNKKNIK